MTDTLSKRDWETISTYLDGQLSPRKQARLEARLQQDHQLRTAFDELRDTRHVLRHVPRLRAPRSFMLTPEMAGQPHRLPYLAPVFGWASAVASFLLVLFLVGDVFTPGGAIPVALNNYPQAQDEFVAPKGAVAENDEAGQPLTDAAGMEESSQPMAELPAPESSEGEAALGSAASSEEEAAPIAEPAASREIELPEPVEEPVSEEPEVNAQAETAPNREGPDTSVAFDAATAEETEVVEQEETHEPRESADDLVQVASITDTVATEMALAEGSEAPLVEETMPAEEELQPAEKAFPTATFSQPTAEIQAAEVAAPEPTQKSDTGYAVAEVTEKPDDFLIGAEVILALLAVGTGLAWLYLRRRKG